MKVRIPDRSPSAERCLFERCLLMSYLVDFLLQGKLVECRERQGQEQADSPIENGEGVTKCAFYFFRRAHGGGRVGHSPVGRQRLSRPNRADLLGSVIADSKDEMELGRAGLRKFIP